MRFHICDHPGSSLSSCAQRPGEPVLVRGTKRSQLMGEQKLAVFSLKPVLLTEKGVGSFELSGEELPSAVLVLSWCLPPLADCVGVYWSQLRPKCLN